MDEDTGRKKELADMLETARNVRDAHSSEYRKYIMPVLEEAYSNLPTGQPGGSKTVAEHRQQFRDDLTDKTKPAKITKLIKGSDMWEGLTTLTGNPSTTGNPTKAHYYSFEWRLKPIAPMPSAKAAEDGACGCGCGCACGCG